MVTGRTTKVIGFSVPPEIYEEVISYAKREKMTKSELFREMVAVYRLKKEEEKRNNLLNPQGVPGKELLKFSRAIDDKSLEQIKEAIENGCGQVDVNEW